MYVIFMSKHDIMNEKNDTFKVVTLFEPYNRSMQTKAPVAIRPSSKVHLRSS